MGADNISTMRGEVTAPGVAARPLVPGIRLMQAVLGLACFGIGAVGAVVPGLPTTVFLLGGSYFLTRSCPALERRLRRSPMFMPYAVFLDGATPLPPQARRAAIAAMWTSIVASAALLAWRGAAPFALGALVAAGLAGTGVILRFRRRS